MTARHCSGIDQNHFTLFIVELLISHLFWSWEFSRISHLSPPAAASFMNLSPCLLCSPGHLPWFGDVDPTSLVLFLIFNHMVGEEFFLQDRTRLLGWTIRPSRYLHHYPPANLSDSVSILNGTKQQPAALIQWRKKFPVDKNQNGLSMRERSGKRAACGPYCLQRQPTASRWQTDGQQHADHRRLRRLDRCKLLS